MNEKTKLQPQGQFSPRPQYGAARDSDTRDSAERRVTDEGSSIQTAESHGSERAATVPGMLSPLAVSAQTNDNQHLDPVNTHANGGPYRQETDNEPEKDKLVTDPPIAHPSRVVSAATTSNNENRVSWQQYWRHFIFAVFVCVIIVIVIVFTFSLLKISSSSSTQVFAGEVVQLSIINRFLYYQTKISQQPPEGAEQAEATIYIDNCAHKVRLNESDFSSRPLPYTAPQGLYNLQQQYLLAGSHLIVNVTTTAPYDSDSSAKVCQYSNAKGYDELLHADSKAEVDKAEKNGLCQPIEPPSGSTPHTTMIQFNIHSRGYYYYALAVFSGDQMNISYTYTLSKKYYDKYELTSPKCSGADEDCVLHGLLEITADNCVLALIPTPAAIEPLLPYTFYTEQTGAWGISIIVFCTLIFICSLLCFITLLSCVWYERKTVNGVV